MTTILTYFQALTANSPDAWFLIATSGDIINRNAAAEKFIAANPLKEINTISGLFPDFDFSAALSKCPETGFFRLNLSSPLFPEQPFIGQFTACKIATAEEYFSFQLIREQDSQHENQELLESQKLLLAAQEVAKVGSWKYDLQTNKLEWSPELFKIFGLEPGSIEPTLAIFWNKVHPEDYPNYYQLVQDTLKNCSSYVLDHRIIRPDGSVGYLQCSGEVILNNTGAPAVLFGMAMDITERKQAEESLKQAVKINEKIMNFSLEIICTLDNKGNFLSINPACEKIWGYKPSEIIGRNSLDFIYPEDIAESLELGPALFSGTPLTHFENRYVHKNGQPVNMLWSANWSEADQILFCIVRDVTPITKAKAALTERDNRFRSLVENGSDLISMISPSGEYIYVSDSVKKILGYHPEEFRGTTPFEFIHEDDLPRVLGNFEQIQHIDQLQTEPFRFKAANGDWRWIETIITNYCHHPDIQSFVTSSRDITERQLTEMQILESEQRYKSLFENHPDAVFSLDTEGNFLTLNQQVATITGFTISEILGTNFRSLIVPDFLEGTVNYFIRALQGTPQTYETTILTNYGHTTSIKVTSIPIIIGGEIIGIYGIAKDVSERNKAIKERQELITRLEQKNKSLQQFAYIVSHNLRAPVANIIGLTRLFQKAGTDDDFNFKVIEKLNQSAVNLDAVIKDLNEILLLGSRISELREPIYFDDIIDAIKISLAGDMQKHLAVLNTDFSQAPVVQSVKSYVHSILFNLLNNAIKYRSEDRLLEVTLTSHISGDFTCLAVQDNGLGINLTKQKDQIFGLYKRFHPQIEGKGLGLHLIKTQLEALGGKVEVESEVGMGSTFKVYFKN